MSILDTLNSAPADAAAAALFAAPAIQYASGTSRSKRFVDGAERNTPLAVTSDTSAAVESEGSSSRAPKKRRKDSKSQAVAADKAAAIEAAAKAAALLGIRSDPGALKKENLRARAMSSAAPSDTEGESRPAVHRQARLPPAKGKENCQQAEASSSADGEESLTAAQGATEAARLARTIFVGNVPPGTSRQALAKHFSSSGAVESVRIRSVASSNLKLAQRAAVIKQAIDTSVRDAVNAYVVFADEAAVVKALSANGQVAFGRHLRVDRAAASKRQAGGDEDLQPTTDSGAASAASNKRSAFLGNLAFDVQEEAIWEAFGPFGTIEYVRLVRDPQTQHGKGFGYVCFTERAPVESALSLHETKLNCRTLRVFRCRGEAAARGGAKGSKGGGKVAAKPGVDWKNRPAASLRLQLAASAKARKKAKGGGIAKKAKGSAAKKAGGNKKLGKGSSAAKPPPTPSQLAHIKAGKNKAKAAAKRSLGGKGRAG
jgi:nucleolar protein 12